MKKLVKLLSLLFSLYAKAHADMNNPKLTKEEKEKLWVTSYWIDLVGRPFAVVLCEALGYKIDAISGPFGIDARMVIRTKKGYTISLVPDLESETFHIRDFNTNTNDFMIGSVGYNHGWNHPLIDIKDFKSLKELKSHFN